MVITDNLPTSNYINKESILQYVSEKDIFMLVFNDIPDDYEYVTSIFREDNNPNCWFEINIDGKLIFVDYANSGVYKNISLRRMDCFDAVMVYYQLSNFYETLLFVKEHLIDSKPNIVLRKPVLQNTHERKEIIITFQSRMLNYSDSLFWKPYGISKQNLIDDKVYAVTSFQMYNTKKGDINRNVNTLCYAYTEFNNKHKKLYQPLYKEGKFITNCKANDIGGLRTLPEHDNHIIITKSYKDFRVLYNLGYNVIWFQNEGMFPDMKILSRILRRFTKVYILFDNDNTGILAGNNLAYKINNTFPGKASSIHLDISWKKDYNVTDPSDCYKIMGVTHLIKFLNNNIKKR